MESVLIPGTHLSPLSYRSIEREILAARDGDRAIQDAFTARMRFTIQHLLGITLVRDAKQLLRNNPSNAVDASDPKLGLYMTIRRDVLSCWSQLYPDEQVQGAGGALVIDLPPTKCIPAKSAAGKVT